MATQPFAVVTGVSTGIGYELARQFAAHGFDLLITAEDEDVNVAAIDLRRDAGHTVDAAQIDLAVPGGVEELYRAIRSTGRPVDALALNAGRGAGGDFVRGTDLQDELEIIDVNVRSTVHLAKRVLSDMVERDQGRVLFTSSIASTTPGAYQAVYAASKSFIQSFAEALQTELQNTGVTITSLMPGPSADQDDSAGVAELGFAALMSGRLCEDLRGR